MANNPIGEPMLTGSDSDEVSSANHVHASAWQACLRLSVVA